MSERDLPSRLLSEQNHNGESRRNIAPHAPIQSSKSVPSLNSKYVTILPVLREFAYHNDEVLHDLAFEARLSSYVTYYVVMLFIEEVNCNL
jgi:hypothetical protein